jgi:hypothetical protein
LGRVWVLVVFGILLCNTVIACVKIASRLGSTGAAYKSEAAGMCFASLFFETGLLAGVWFRQNWARWMLVVILIWGVFKAFVGVMEAFKVDFPSSVWTTLLVLGSAHAICAWALISSRDIRRLADRFYD